MDGRLVNCPLCGHDETTYLLTTHDRLHGIAGSWQIRRCHHCVVAFLHPMPAVEDIGSFYPDDYYAYYPPRVGQRSLFRQLRFDAAAAVNLGYLRRFPRSRLIDWSNHLFAPVLNIPPYIDHGHLLDIGCGSGQYLLNLSQLGWDVSGVELNPKAVEAACQAGLNVRCATISQAEYRDQSFDYVRMNDVLEHLPRPDDALREIHRILKDCGKVEITLPNLDAWTFDLFGRYWFPLEVPRHLFFYTPDSMRYLAKMCGFAVESIVIWSHKEVDVVDSMRYLLAERHPRLLACVDHPLVWKLYRKLFALPKAFATKGGRGSAMTVVLAKI
ncbi:MAG: class I SAM-dependent methyltransferase [Mariprofundales bacterium]|nr:class I SAM-dependent methyltransferase [Mariprofundales bacterium]